MKRISSSKYSLACRLVLAGAGVLATAARSQAQGTIGFSGQTQPSRVLETQFVPKANFDSARATNRFRALRLDPARVTTVAPGDVDIVNEAKVLTVYDDLEIGAESRRGLGGFRVGIVSDGDFNKNTSAGNVSTAKAGSLGIDAVWMKPVYYTRTYYHFRPDTSGLTLAGRRRRAASRLVGEQTVLRPLWSFDALAILLSGTGALSTNVPAGAARTAVTTQTQQRAFGQALLVPSGYVSGNGVAFVANATFNLGVLAPDWTLYKNLGLMANLSVVQTNWATRDTTTAVNILAPSFGVKYRLVEANFRTGEQNNYVLVQPFVRYTVRHLFGDIQHQPQLLHDALSTTRRDFHGLDMGVMLTVNAIRFTLNVPVFGGADIAGFTQGQTVVGFGVAAAIPLTDAN